MDGLLRFHGSDALLSQCECVTRQCECVDGSIGVAVYGQAAHRTQMPPVRQLLLGAAFQPVRAVAAPGTVLRGVSRVDGNDLTPGTFSLRREDGTKSRPRGVTDALGKTVVAEHIPDAQFFDSDDAETVDDTTGVLMAEIVPSVPDALSR